MTHAQEIRAREFDRQMWMNKGIKQRMAKAYAIVRAAYADVSAPKTYRLDIDPSGAQMYVQVTYTGDTGMKAKPCVVTVADMHGTVYVDEAYRYGVGVIARVHVILTRAGRA